MKLSNFILTATKGKNALDWEYFAEVDVTTGILFWTKTVRRKIRREYCGLWHFVDTGEYLPVFQINDLARAWEARTGDRT